LYTTIRIASSRSATTVEGVFSDSKSRRPKGFKGDVGETALQDGALLLGLGERAKLNRERLRKAGGGLVRGLDRFDIRAATINIDLKPQNDLDSNGAIGQCLAEGAGLANWRVDFFTGSAAKPDEPKPSLSLHAKDRAMNDGLKRGLALAESTNYARRLAATPPNICNPAWMAKEAQRLARQFDSLSCKVISYAEAQKLGMGGIVSVGRASDSKPCLIHLEHKPPRIAPKAKNAHPVLIGKTITYDTGGYSLKISNGMKGMKYDKCGGMAVIGAMHAAASLKIPVRISALLPAAENMVSGDAYRPDDIITMYNGVSVEVTNTDAEGRLVLADALAYACAKLKPSAIIDVATLTGGVVVALGSWSAGLFCEDDGLRERVYDAANASGEMVWRLPLWEPHREFMRAKHADIWNSGPKRDGHPIQGAAFLSYFVDEKIPWAHIDIAGVSNVESDTDLCCTGPTGFGVRLLADLAEGFA